ncbi:MAG: SsrA-binding protein [Chloroflexi bacterium RBG_13_56_8]|nr:MAG: SsrA-binding protein [Chloroflexi bacterium RBG_13_56_8]
MAGKKKRGAPQDAHGGDRVVATNRKAFHDYFIEDRMEAGVVLVGSEIKSIRAGQVNLRDSYVTIRNDEAWLVGSHIAGYAQASYQDHDPRRDRKLLLHRREIDRLRIRVEQKGYTIVPVRLYLKSNVAKVEIGLARGKRDYDKRDAIAQRDADRDIQRALKQAQRGEERRAEGAERD